MHVLSWQTVYVLSRVTFRCLLYHYAARIKFAPPGHTLFSISLISLKEKITGDCACNLPPRYGCLGLGIVLIHQPLADVKEFYMNIIPARFIAVDGWPLMKLLSCDFTGPHWLYVNIGSGKGFVPPGSKSPLSEPMFTQIYVAIRRHCCVSLWQIHTCRFTHKLSYECRGVYHHQHDQPLQPSLRCRGPLTRYVKLRVAHAPGMPVTFPPPPTSKDTAS